jgi:hypothetical protein
MMAKRATQRQGDMPLMYVLAFLFLEISEWLHAGRGCGATGSRTTSGSRLDTTDREHLSATNQ